MLSEVISNFIYPLAIKWLVIGELQEFCRRWHVSGNHTEAQKAAVFLSVKCIGPQLPRRTCHFHKGESVILVILPMLLHYL